MTAAPASHWTRTTAVLVLAFTSACVICPQYRMQRTRKQVAANWNARVATHSFRYDDAVVLKGPPTQSEDLEDGRRVSVWTWHHEQLVSNPGDAFNAGFSHLPAPPPTRFHRVETLKLVFDREHVLTSWSWTYE